MKKETYKKRMNKQIAKFMKIHYKLVDLTENF